MADPEWKKLALRLLKDEPNLTHRERAEKCGVSLEAMKRFYKAQSQLPKGDQILLASGKPSDGKPNDGRLSDTQERASCEKNAVRGGVLAGSISGRPVCDRTATGSTIADNTTSLPEGLGNIVQMLQAKQLDAYSKSVEQGGAACPSQERILEVLANKLPTSKRGEPITSKQKDSSDGLIDFLMTQSLVSSKDPNDQLYTAAELGDLKLVEALIPKANDLNWRYRDGTTALWISSRRGHKAVAKRLLCEPGVRIDADSLGSGSVLHLWSEKAEDDAELLLMILGKGADVNDVDEHNQTALFLAARRGHAKIVRLLLERGADPSIRQGASDCLPFTSAAEKGHLDALRVLFEFSRDGSPIDYADGLCFAAQNNHMEVVRTLLTSWAASPNVLSSRKMTPIFCAAANGNKETVSLLMGAGAADSVFAPCELQEGLEFGSALEVAFVSGHTDCLADMLTPMMLHNGSEAAMKKHLKEGMREIESAATEVLQSQGKPHYARDLRSTAERYPKLFRAPELVTHPVIFCQSEKPGQTIAASSKKHVERNVTSSEPLSDSEMDSLTSESARAMGNDMLKQGNKRKALGYYGKAFQLSGEKCKLAASNAAECCLRLERFADAMHWTERAMHLDPDHEKTLFRHVKALGKVRRTTEGCIFLADYFAKTLGGKERMERNRLEELRMELFHACVSSSKHTKAFTRGLYVERVDAAAEGASFPSYRIRTAIAIPALKYITKETAFLPWALDILHDLDRFLSTVTDEKIAMCNGMFPRHFEEFQPALDTIGSLKGLEDRVAKAMAKHDRKIAEELGARMVRSDRTSAETRRKLMRILGCARISSHTDGLYHFGALYNHSCAPNCEVHGVHDWEMITVRDIEPGEELSFSYHGGGGCLAHGIPQGFYGQLEWDAPLRRCSLRKGFGFWCGCTRCKEEDAANQGKKSHSNGQNTDVNDPSVIQECAAAEKGWIEFQQKVIPVIDKAQKKLFLDAKTLREVVPNWHNVHWQKCYLIGMHLGFFHDGNEMAPLKLSVEELERYDVLKHALQLAELRQDYLYPHSRFNQMLHTLQGKLLQCYLEQRKVPRDASMGLKTLPDVIQKTLALGEFVRPPSDITVDELAAAKAGKNIGPDGKQSKPDQAHGNPSKSYVDLLAKAQGGLSASDKARMSTEEKFQEHLRQRAVHDKVLDVDKDLEETKKMVKMFRMMPPQAAAKIGPMGLMKRQPPDLHGEYLKLEKLSGSTFPTSAMSARMKAWCARSFERGYWTSCVQPWMLSMGLRMGQPGAIDDQEVARRYGGLTKARAAQQWMNAQRNPVKCGEVIRWRHDTMMQAPYTDIQRSSYSNNPNKAVRLEFGKTHVAVGFNDLRILANGIYDDLQSESLKSDLFAAVRFIGIDCSPYAVAKSLVIAAMLQMEGDAVPEHVLQVWYSAAWSNAATKTFKSAVAKALAEHKTGGNIACEFQGKVQNKAKLSDFEKAADRACVREYLQFWLCADAPSLQHAREQWVNSYHPNNPSRTRTMGFINSMKRENDRQAVSQYMVSGDVFCTEKPGPQDMIGSMCNYAVPARSPYLDDDLIFNAVGWDELITRFEVDAEDSLGDPLGSEEALKKGGECAKTGPQKKAANSPADIVEQTTKLLFEQIQSLHHLVQKKKVVVELYCVRVSAEDPALTKAIRDLCPSTFTWSNVLDYFRVPAEFHEMARACSLVHLGAANGIGGTSNGTRHYGYSMNWPEVTFGTHLIDYPLEEQRNILTLSEETDPTKWNTLGMCSSIGSNDSRVNASAASVGLDCSLNERALHGARVGDDRVEELALATRVQDVIRGRVTYPPFDSPFNTTGWILMDRYANKWMDYFFEGEEVNLLATGGIPYQPLMKSANNIVCFSWTYVGGNHDA